MLFYIEINFNIKGSIKEIFKKYFKEIFHRAIEKIFPPRHWNTGLVSSGASLTSWGEGASLALVGHPSTDGVTIKMPHPRDFEILGWCPAGPVLPHGGKVPL